MIVFKRIEIDTLDLVCEALGCKVSDFPVRTPNDPLERYEDYRSTQVNERLFLGAFNIVLLCK